MARSVVDLAILLEATVGGDPADPTTVPVRTYVDAVDPEAFRADASAWSRSVETPRWRGSSVQLSKR